MSQIPSLVAPTQSLFRALLGLCIASSTLLSSPARADDVGESVALQLSTGVPNTYAFRGFVLATAMPAGDPRSSPIGHAS